MPTTSTATTTGAIYGIGVFGTDRYGVSATNISLKPDGVVSLVKNNFVSISINVIGATIPITFNGVVSNLKTGRVSITANIFNFDSVRNNYERRRTVFINRRSTASEKIVKVA